MLVMAMGTGNLEGASSLFLSKRVVFIRRIKLHKIPLVQRNHYSVFVYAFEDQPLILFSLTCWQNIVQFVSNCDNIIRNVHRVSMVNPSTIEPIIDKIHQTGAQMIPIQCPLHLMYKYHTLILNANFKAMCLKRSP